MGATGTFAQKPVWWTMGARLSVLALLALTSCTDAFPPAVARHGVNGRPLDSLPPEADLTLVRQDLLATASARLGAKALSEARAAPAHLIAKRFVGMAPPPPAGAGPDWVPPTPTALLMRRPDGWMVATGSGWRRAEPDVSAELDQLFADQRFWSEAAYIPPCPDYGASLLLVKIPGKAETVRKSSCTSVAEKGVLAALRA